MLRNKPSVRRQKRRSVAGGALSAAGRLLAWPAALFPRKEVVDAGRAIASLIAGMGSGEWRDRRFLTYEDRSFDLEGTSFCYGISVWELEQRLARRRRQTARASYMLFGFGWVCFVFWLYRLATAGVWGWRIETLIEFAPFCLLLFLLAFWSALQNYQIRMRRLASAGEYLTTERGFWPS